MTTAKNVLKMIKDNDVKFVDYRFTDPRGKWQHVTFDTAFVDEDTFVDGIMFDGSSISGWKVINESDMKLMPDPESATIDPFFAQTTLSIVCDVLEPLTDEPYGRDPRSIAKKKLFPNNRRRYHEAKTRRFRKDVRKDLPGCEKKLTFLSNH